MTSLSAPTFKFKVFWWSLLLFVFTIPFPQIVSIKLLILTLVLSLFVEGDFKRLFSRAWDSILYMVALLIGLTYAIDLQAGLKHIEYNLSFLALPILLVKVQIDQRRFREIFHAFSAGLLLASCVCVGYAIYQFSQSGDWGVFLFNRLTDIIDSHPTYFTYYLITVVTGGLYLLFNDRQPMLKPLLIGSLIFLFAVLLCTGGSTAFVSMLLVLAFFVLKFLLDEKTRSRVWSLALVVAMIVGMFGFSSINSHHTSADRTDDYWERIVLWESALHATPNIILGAGTGDGEVLNNYYNSHQHPEYAELGYNAHNQFLQTFVTNGIVGLVVLLIFLGRPLFLSIRDKNVLATLIFFSFLIYGMTEVFLGRYQGIVFFVLAHQVFMGFHYDEAERLAYRKAE